MNRTEFIIATAIILFLAFGLGWFAHWIVSRFARVSGDMSEVDRLAQHLHEAEEARDQALVYIETREEELGTRLAETEAELRAAMEGLREARAEAEELRAHIARITRG
ncbi:hypothetical protein SAMN05878503_107143 [Cereibacter ovatus]|uniref:Uncharacterized protein n=1 Tax=Cereibacter ovatus TaxID=439529 RepID=A0A285CVF5_9RHOB|nr:hypothetical protein [Cereibacter ovatus]SNX71028.1 hypothetical protein SAMN05878503_107143 [Cereibacter ovatus]